MDGINSLIADFAQRIRGDAPMPIVHKAYGARPLGVILPPPATAEKPPELSKPDLTQAETLRAESILRKVAERVLTNALKRKETRDRRSILFGMFDRAIRAQCERIEQAAKIKPSVANVVEEIEAKRKAERQALANELRKARSRLRWLQYRIENAEKIAAKEIAAKGREERRAWAARLTQTRARFNARRQRQQDELDRMSELFVQQLGAQKAGCYPDVASPAVAPSLDGEGLPSSPGIYFLWKDGVVDYVGQSVRICDRVRLKTHHVLTPTHTISYVPVRAEELDWAECYYIGTLRPVQNFGARAAHKIRC